MRITAYMLNSKLLLIAKENAPVRKLTDKKGRPRKRAVGKKGTNMYSPYPGNLKNNGIHRTENGVTFDYNKVGYIGYANARSSKPRFIEKTVEDFCTYCVSLGGRIVKR
ncbi:MAG: hypothetical protein IJB34_04420 [Clostridia bacterium]|nr:hypothetical protein [Clostridia bacterium]